MRVIIGVVLLIPFVARLIPQLYASRQPGLGLPVEAMVCLAFAALIVNLAVAFAVSIVVAAPSRAPSTRRFAV